MHTKNLRCWGNLTSQPSLDCRKLLLQCLENFRKHFSQIYRNSSKTFLTICFRYQSLRKEQIYERTVWNKSIQCWYYSLIHTWFKVTTKISEKAQLTLWRIWSWAYIAVLYHAAGFCSSNPAKKFASETIFIVIKNVQNYIGDLRYSISHSHKIDIKRNVLPPLNWYSFVFDWGRSFTFATSFGEPQTTVFSSSDLLIHAFSWETLHVSTDKIHKYERKTWLYHGRMNYIWCLKDGIQTYCLGSF